MNRPDFPPLPLMVLVGAALWLTRTSAAQGAEQRILCPPSLAPQSVHGEASSGWRLVMPQEAQLSAAGMLHGAPEESGYLKPAESKVTRQGKLATWRQRWAFDQPHPYRTFAYCGYGGGVGPLQLFMRIAADATECTLISSTKDGVLERSEFVCK